MKRYHCDGTFSSIIVKIYFNHLNLSILCVHAYGVINYTLVNIRTYNLVKLTNYQFLAWGRVRTERPECSWCRSKLPTVSWSMLTISIRITRTPSTCTTRTDNSTFTSNMWVKKIVFGKTRLLYITYFKNERYVQKYM